MPNKKIIGKGFSFNKKKDVILLINFGLLISICLISLLIVEIPIVFLWTFFFLSFVILASKSLAHSTNFIMLYYFILILSYFLVGYFGVYRFNQYNYITIFYSQILIGAFHFLPFFIIFGLSFYSKYFRRILFHQYFIVILLLAYILIINILHHNFGKELFIQIRNFLAPFVAFLWGFYASNKIKFQKFYKLLFLIALWVILFGFFEYLLKYDFWLNFFPCYFVSLIKKAGTLDNGLIGNKIIGMNNKVFFRMSSFFYEPKFAGYNFVFYFFFLIALIKEQLIRFSPKILEFFCLLVLLICIILTFIKSAWGVFAITIIILILLKFIGINKFKKHKTVGILGILVLGFFITIVLLTIFLKLGITSTTMAHVKATLQIFQFSYKELVFGKQGKDFDILNSDSGLLTIISSIGFIGYFMVTFGIIQILKNILEDKNFTFMRLTFFSLIIAWFMALHFKSDVWSPLGNFIIFFTAGLISKLQTRYYSDDGKLYHYPYRHRS